MSELEQWGIHVDGIALFGFDSSEAATKYKEDNLQDKDAVVFPCQQAVKKSNQEEYYCAPGHA